MGGHQYFEDKYTIYSYSHLAAENIIPKGAKNKEQCGCYSVKTVSESDRVWVTYTHIHISYHYCKDHLKKHLTNTTLSHKGCA